MRHLCIMIGLITVHFVGLEMPKGPRYSDNEIIYLAKINRGFGLDRMVSVIYGLKAHRTRHSVKFIDSLETLKEHEAYTGEDIYSWVQDPSMIKMVTREEWRKATDNAPVPSGHGLSTSRGKKGNKYQKTGSNAKAIPLPPMEFFWGDVVPLSDRD